MNKLPPKEYLEVIGLISVKHGIVERNLMIAISQLIGIDSSITNRLISGESFDILLFKLKKVLFYKLDKKQLLDVHIRNEWKYIYKRLDEINKTRNDILHSRWYIEKEDIVMHKYISRIGNTPSISKEEIKNLKSLQDFADDISVALKELQTFKEKIIDLLSN
jgi:hypothetical protein